MTCSRIRKKLIEAFTGSGFLLDAESKAHLEDCPECRLYYHDLQLMGERFKESGSFELTNFEAERMSAGIAKAIGADSRESQVSTGRWSLFGRRLTPVLVSGLAAVILLMTILVTGDNNAPEIIPGTYEYDMAAMNVGEDDMASILEDSGADLWSLLFDESSADYITLQVSSDQAESILDGMSSEEIEWLMDNYTLEL